MVFWEWAEVVACKCMVFTSVQYSCCVGVCGDGDVGDLYGGDVDEILKSMVIVVVVMSMFSRFRMMNCNYWLCC